MSWLWRCIRVCRVGLAGFQWRCGLCLGWDIYVVSWWYTSVVYTTWSVGGYSHHEKGKSHYYVQIISSVFSLVPCTLCCLPCHATLVSVQAGRVFLVVVVFTWVMPVVVCNWFMYWCWLNNSIRNVFEKSDSFDSNFNIYQFHQFCQHLLQSLLNSTLCWSIVAELAAIAFVEVWHWV